MEKYPHTEYYNHRKGTFDEIVWGFEKIDGSNFRVEWQRKNSKKSNFTFGFVKFGTRTQMISRVDQNFGDGVEYFDENFAEPLNKLFIDQPFFRKHDKVTVFCEPCYHQCDRISAVDSSGRA